MAHLLHVSPADLRRMSYRELRIGLTWVESYMDASRQDDGDGW